MMRNVIALITLFFAVMSGYAQETNADLGVMAIGLVVSDIQRSEQFYTKVIGMKAAGSFSLDAQWSREAGAGNNKPFSVKMFKLVSGNTATILKLAYFDEVGPRPEQTGVDGYAGINYLTLHYSDLKPVLKRIEEAGIEKVGWVKRDSYQLVFIKDPDGVFIELVGPPEE